MVRSYALWICFWDLNAVKGFQRDKTNTRFGHVDTLTPTDYAIPVYNKPLFHIYVVLFSARVYAYTCNNVQPIMCKTNAKRNKQINTF